MTATKRFTAMVGVIFMTSHLTPAILYAADKQTLIDMPALTWLSVPDTQGIDVAPSASAYPNIQCGQGAPAALSYSGGILDTKRDRLVIWGGGHNDYCGNELYAFNIGAMTWQLLTQPTANPSINSCTNSDGTPGSRHTYNGLAYIAHVDRMFALGGSVQGSGFAECRNLVTFDFANPSKIWVSENDTGTLPGGSFENNAAYDPVTKKVWYGHDGIAGGGSGLYSYSYDTNSWIKHNSDGLTYRASTVDTKRGLLIFVGKGEVRTYNIRNASVPVQVWATTGGGGFINEDQMGIDYDPVADRIVGMARTTTASVYILDPVTKVWSAHTVSGAPNTNVRGVYGRFRYVPSVNAFIMVSDLNQNVSFFKLTPGAGSPPDASTPAAPRNLTVQ